MYTSHSSSLRSYIFRATSASTKQEGLTETILTPLAHEPQPDHDEKVENDGAAQRGDHVRSPLFSSSMGSLCEIMRRRAGRSRENLHFSSCICSGKQI